MIQVGHKTNDFECDAYHDGEIKKIRLSFYEGKWLVLLFYPADFTFVCPTELEDAARGHEGEVCPANWRPGKKTLRPGMDLIGKI